ncbi:porin family protein [Mucilaginibacter auburnensis]|uniref:Outer membrane protein with beta-barrel domain n=1 Tax=Mucilaginibacter auburnensis TaxID=1457233 RepID=A0A2H9VUP3_9SPHI|nr:porin family protein [Mucilaginibacter auburnensis]PJJ84537.1 outer membrane protein with beta-barrel domain [Mucilaginibacter auburnensis]
MAKRLSFLAFFILLGCTTLNAQILYGVRVAGGFAYQQVKSTSVRVTGGSVKTFNIYGFAQAPLNNDFWLSASLGITNKGSIVYDDALTTTTRLTYIELPVSVLKKFNIPNTGWFFIGAGGYAAMGLKGRLDFETPGSNTFDVVRYGKDNDAKRFDTGLSFSTGFELRNKLVFNVGYSLGLNNIASEPQQATGTSTVKNRIFTVGLGYIIK